MSLLCSGFSLSIRKDREERKRREKEETRRKGIKKNFPSPSHNFSITRSFADRALGLLLHSFSPATMGLRVTNFATAGGGAGGGSGESEIALREETKPVAPAPLSSSSSSSEGAGFPAAARKALLTTLSSPEWKEMTASLPPGSRRSMAFGKTSPRAPSSSLTARRRAWKTRVAG